MYAVIRSGGKQYRVAPGQTVRLEKVSGDPGSKVELGNVILVEDGGVKTGEPVAKAKIEATILETDRADKIIVFKKKRKKQYRRTRGHRQSFTAVRIDKIVV
jgi:large subunit ribosomal protein L21